MSVAQAARTWWAATKNPVQGAARRIGDLRSYRMVKRITVLARPELPIEKPLTIWAPGDPQPDFAALSYILINRFSETPVPTSCIIATAEAAHHYGGWGGRFPKNAECTHDLHLTAIYLHFLRFHPHLCTAWFSEEWLKRNRQETNEKRPDAIIREGSRSKIIEFGGEYSKQKLFEFHEHCAHRGMPYEIW
jgi:hypothetical protein